MIAAAFAAVMAATPHAPSLVLVTLDTTRADRLGCYGSPGGASPSLDALAVRGVRFDRAHSPSPLTAPAHATLLTGRVPRRHGVRDNAGFVLDASVPSLAGTLRDAGYDTRAFVSSYVLDRGVGLARGFAHYDDAMRGEERPASRTVEAALAALPQMTAPFFLWVHLYDPHLPYAPPEPYRTRFAKQPYDGEIAFMDAEIGRLLTALRRRSESLVIAVAGDHGESLGEHGEDGHGVFLYQATQRVPLILSGRGVPTGRAVTANVGLVDLAPTLLALLSQPPLPDADGRSLLPLLGGTRLAEADYEMETLYPEHAFGWAPLRALVSGTLKYVDAPRPELYELPTDPRETNDLSGVPARGERRRALASALARRVAGDAPAPAEDTERLDRLHALGYAGGARGVAAAPSIDPKDAIGWLRELETARRFAAEGKPATAAASLESLLARNPGNLQALFALVGAYQGSGAWPKATSAARRAIALSPRSATAHLHLASSLAGESAKRPEARGEAERAYDETMALAPRLTETYVQAAVFYLSSKRPEEARGVLERARAAGIADPTIETALGGIELARGNRAAAIAAYERAVALDPGEAKALEALGRLRAPIDGSAP